MFFVEVHHLPIPYAIESVFTSKFDLNAGHDSPRPTLRWPTLLSPAEAAKRVTPFFLFPGPSMRRSHVGVSRLADMRCTTFSLPSSQIYNSQGAKKLSDLIVFCALARKKQPQHKSHPKSFYSIHKVMKIRFVNDLHYKLRFYLSLFLLNNSGDMNNILVLTDFSENANHAAKAAPPLAAKLHSDIIIFNSYYNHPVIPAYAGGPLAVDELVFRKKDSTSGLHQLARQLGHLHNGQAKEEFKPQIHTQCGEGPLGNNLAAIINGKKTAFIVMGGSLNSPVNHLFFGSDTMDVVDHASCPVVIIPQEATLEKLKKITLATAFEPFDNFAITYLANLSKKLDFELEIVHISVFEKYEDPDKEKALLRHIKKLEDSGIVYKQIRGKDVIERLNHLCKENGSDMLALVHYEHGFLSGIFKKSTTEKALGHQHIPLMIIPADIQ